jgi:hypothetical protein
MKLWNIPHAAVEYSTNCDPAKLYLPVIIHNTQGTLRELQEGVKQSDMPVEGRKEKRDEIQYSKNHSRKRDASFGDGFGDRFCPAQP